MTKLLLSRNEIRERGRNIANNCGVKIEATTGREMNTSKSGKTTVQPTPSVDLDSSVLMGRDGAGTVHAPKQSIVTQKESGKL